jgi:hypothetical protein
MRLLLSIPLLSAAMMAAPAAACDFDGMYGGRFSAFANLHNLAKSSEDQDAILSINQQDRKPVRVTAAISDLEVQPDEIKSPATQIEAEVLRKAVKQNQPPTKFPAAVKR